MDHIDDLLFFADAFGASCLRLQDYTKVRQICLHAPNFFTQAHRQLSSPQRKYVEAFLYASLNFQTLVLLRGMDLLETERGALTLIVRLLQQTPQVGLLLI
ncbi:hypothetical protein ACET3Z_023327 [Daucus carota]